MALDMIKFKALITGADFADGGLLNAEQATAFIDKVLSEQVTLPMINVMRMVRNGQEMDSLDIDPTQIRKHTAGQKGDSASITTSKRTINIGRVKIYFDIDMDTLESETILSDKKNVNGKLRAYIMNRASVAFGNGMNNLAYNGDTESANEFLQCSDGWIKYAKADAVTYDTNGSTDLMGVVFPALLKAMPFKYKKNKKIIKFFVNPDDHDLYIDQLADRNDNTTDYVTGRVNPKYKGYEVVADPYIPQGTYFFTPVENLVFGIDSTGIKQLLEVHDIAQTVETGILAKIGFQIKEADALVIGYDAA